MTVRRRIFDMLIDNFISEKTKQKLIQKAFIFHKLRLVCKSFFHIKKLHQYRSKVKRFVLQKLTKEKCDAKLMIYSVLLENHKIFKWKTIVWKKS